MLTRMILAVTISLAGFSFSCGQESGVAQPGQRPIRALLICGGCCHDYAQQHKILCDGIQSRANIQVDVWWTDDKSTNPPLTVFDNVNWANNYDVIIHDECAARNTDVEVVKRILEVHKKTPAVHLHCAMHCFRNGTDLWFKHLGLQSSGHGPHLPIDVKFVDKEHPIVQGLDDWTIEKDELYNNVKLFDAQPLAMGTQTVTRKGVKTTQEAVVVWTNEKQGARSFSMSIGHYNEGVADERYLNLVTRGVLWACDKLSPDYQKPFGGENKVTFVASKSKTTSGAGAKPKVMPKNAKLVHVFASSTQDSNIPANILDGDPATRWCAKDSSYPQWIQLDFEKPQSITGIRIKWERDVAYQHKILVSSDGNDFVTAFDLSANKTDEPSIANFDESNDPIKSIRIEGIGTRKGGWCSIREVQFKGKMMRKLWPADEKFQPMFQPTPAGKQPGN